MIKKSQIVIWSLLVLFETSAQISVKLTANALNGHPFNSGWFAALLATPWIWLLISCYIASFLVWMVILAKRELSSAFSLSSMCYVTVIFSSWLIFKETVLPLQWLGITFIAIGIILVSSESELKP